MKPYIIRERAGGGVTGGEVIAIEAVVLEKKKPGFWSAIKYFFCPDRCVARISAYDEWCEAGWESVLPELRDRLSQI